MAVDDLRDAFSREGLLPKAPLDVVQDFRVRGVRLVEHVLQREVRRAESVAEVLREDPAAVYTPMHRREKLSKRVQGSRRTGRTGVDGLLDGVRARGGAARVEEGVVRESVEQRSFLGDLED